MSKGFFGDLFDLNHDGELDSRERLLDYMAFDEMTQDEEEDDDEDEEYDDIEMAGLDYDELEMMDEDERRKALEDAGLDPDDYDFYL